MIYPIHDPGFIRFRKEFSYPDDIIISMDGLKYTGVSGSEI